ncbi:MAG: hypothetical protein WBW71_11545 [Bacteroidota bacterium]
MTLQQIFDDLNIIAKSQSSADQLDSFQKTALQLLYASDNDDESDNRPLAFDQVTIDQIKALEHPSKVENPNDFQQIILFLDKLFHDHTLSINIRILAAGLAFSKYQTTIPASGLPLDNEHIKGCLRWGQRVVEADIIGSQFEEHHLQRKEFHAKWLSSFYSRRNANGLAAECYARLGADAAYSPHCKYSDVKNIQRECIAFYQAAITDSHTLRSPEVNALIRAIKIHIAFCKDVPEDKKTYKLYISPGGALQQINAIRRGEETPPVLEGGTTSQDEDVEEALGETIQGTAMWVNAERWDAERTVTVASGLLGKLFAKTPKAEGEEPDYKQAAIWLRVARHCAYVDIREELEIPGIQAELTALESPTGAGMFHNANNPASSQHAGQTVGTASNVLTAQQLFKQ